ncbi:MAG: hypothetical protein HN352_09495 [Bacteroidetes bacterium]|jgi:hypothetical protein|nr:hypothetical protein [Bacteroidota bacterium]MBT3749894.1 hypothetical protein [Bacteroidota bacterium]MBT4408753.1 hypothetical protein [Bacteroidota bacterium]MBT7092052.1 hypothetical protein [Bacteroidota bacterium]MBT7465185.1 hypothetical protein [Bacteroidota bacterium]
MTNRILPILLISTIVISFVIGCHNQSQIKQELLVNDSLTKVEFQTSKIDFGNEILTQSLLENTSIQMLASMIY